MLKFIPTEIHGVNRFNNRLYRRVFGKEGLNYNFFSFLSSLTYLIHSPFVGDVYFRNSRVEKDFVEI